MVETLKIYNPRHALSLSAKGPATASLPSCARHKPNGKNHQSPYRHRPYLQELAHRGSVSDDPEQPRRRGGIRSGEFDRLRRAWEGGAELGIVRCDIAFSERAERGRDAPCA